VAEGRLTDGILGFREVASRSRATWCRAAVTVMVVTATVPVNRMGPPALVALGRGPVVTPGAAGWFRSGDVVELLAAGGVIRTQRLAALVRGRVADCSVDDGLGGKPGGDHTGGTIVVGHVWLGRVVWDGLR